MEDVKEDRRWRVEFRYLAYDGGGSSSWTDFYRTKLGAYFFMYWHVYIASWGGEATLYDKETLLRRIKA